MDYQRPKMKYNQDEFDYYLAHKHIWEEIYKKHGHKFDYTISYEELFKMNELCGIPLKDYHEEFTIKLNKYTREEMKMVWETQKIFEDETMIFTFRYFQAGKSNSWFNTNTIFKLNN